MEEAVFKKLRASYEAIQESIKNLDTQITVKSLSQPTSMDEFDFINESLEVVKTNIEKMHLIAGTSIC